MSARRMIDVTKPFAGTVARAHPMMNNKRSEGNAEYQRGKFEEAASLYSQALKLAKDEQEAIPLFLARSLARHSAKRYEQAIADLEVVLDLDPENEKALLRKARALYGLEKYVEAEAALLQLKDVRPDHPNLKGDLARCAKRRQEGDNGRYDFAAMLEEAAKKIPKPDMDRGVYSSPAMERKACQEEGKGRGMFATRDIEVGELLLVEKAFATVFNEDIPSVSGETKDQQNLDPKTGLTSIKSNRAMQEELLEIVIQDLERNPSKVAQFANLYPGPNTQEEFEPDLFFEDGTPVPIINSRDSILARILYNSFAFPHLSRDFHWRAAHSGMDSPATAHEAAAATPTTTTTTTTHTGSPDTKTTNGTQNAESINAPEMDPNSSVGVWLRSSFFNHSCNPSIRRAFIGDMIIWRAQLPILKGHEITTGYVTNHEALADRTADLKNWGFECRCPRCACQAKESDQVRERRQAIMGEIIDAFEKPNPTSMEDYLLVLERLRATYADSSTRDYPRTILFLPCITLIRGAFYEDMPDMVVKLALFLLRALGFEILIIPSREWRVLRWGMYDDEVVGVMGEMWRAYAEVDPELLRDVEKYLRLAYLVVCGEDSSFEERYGSLRHGFGGKGKAKSVGWMDPLVEEKEAVGKKEKTGEKEKAQQETKKKAEEGKSTEGSSCWPGEWRDSVVQAPRPTNREKTPSPPAEPLSPLYKVGFDENSDEGEDEQGDDDDDVNLNKDGEKDDGGLDEEGDDMEALVKQVNTKLGMKGWRNGGSA